MLSMTDGRSMVSHDYAACLLQVSDSENESEDDEENAVDDSNEGFDIDEFLQ